MTDNSRIISLIVKINTLVLLGCFIALFLIYRFPYDKKDNITSNQIYLSGLTDGMSVTCGTTIENIFLSFPDFVDASDIYSVSSDPEVAYLKIDNDNILGNRVLICEVVCVAPGIAELYARTSDGKYVTENYFVNVYEDGSFYATTEPREELKKGNVYITRSGKKYHLKYSCAGENSYQVTLEDAVKQGYQSCKICAVAK